MNSQLALFAIFFMASLMPVILANGSCQMYGHSCLGGHGKRSAFPNPPASDPPGQFPGTNDSDEDLLRQNGFQESVAKLKERLDLLGDESAKESNRVQQYRLWKRMSSVYGLLNDDLRRALIRQSASRINAKRTPMESVVLDSEMAAK